MRRYYIWKRFDNAVRPIESKYAKVMKKFYFELKREIMNNVMDRGDDLLKSIKADNKKLFDINKAKKDVIDLSSPYIEEALKTGGNIALSEAGITGQFEIVNTNSIAAFNKRLNAIKDVIDTVSEQVDKTINDGIESGKTLAQVAEDISDKMGNVQWKAERIARTEIIGASNQGKFLAFEENGIEKLEWIHSYDEKVRDDHLIDEVVKVGEEFSNGLKYPGDRSGSESTPENIINCRCSSAPAGE